MKTALGMIEFKTVASGITATDIMLKTADVEVIQANPVCPGKYLATISGEISSVKAAIEAAERYNSSMLIDKFILGNPHVYRRKHLRLFFLRLCDAPGQTQMAGVDCTSSVSDSCISAVLSGLPYARIYVLCRNDHFFQCCCHQLDALQ